ncbi:gamma-glutamylcyclotransferase [Microbacter sp. GSS18]|nr:gamma-glutamylcyclotransferase [Microbacter sp. GSS18]
MPAPLPAIPLFVYGSLRPGGELWGAIEPHVIEARPAIVPGRLVWHEGMQWPLLLADASFAETVRGDLLMLRPGDEVNRVIVDEELLYGYDVRWTTVLADPGGASAEVRALVFVWSRDDEIGPDIISGDFAAAWAARTPTSS